MGDIRDLTQGDARLFTHGKAGGARIGSQAFTLSVGLSGFGRAFKEAIEQFSRVWSNPWAGQLEERQHRWRSCYPDIPAELGIALIVHTAQQTPYTFATVSGYLIGASYHHPPELDGFPPEWRLAYWERQMRRMYRLDNSHGLMYAHLPNLTLIRAYERRDRDAHKRTRTPPRQHGAARYHPFPVRPTPGNVGQPGQDAADHVR